MVRAEASSNPAVKVVKRARIEVPPTKKTSGREHKAPATPKATPKPSAAAIASSSKPKPSILKPSKPVVEEKPTKNKPKAANKKVEDAAPLPSTFKIIAGSYEKLLYGLTGSTSINAETGNVEFTIKPIFIFPAHVSCIKSVAASPQGGKWLASGSADEIIKIWDLRRRKEVGGLMHHQGSVTHLQFPSRSHLLSASEDGSLCLFRARDWSVLRSLKGHKGRVNSVAIHPSGKVALSVGHDRALRMWDLMRGKGVASTKLGKEGEVVKWSVTGSRFAVQSGSTIDIYSTGMELLHTITHPSRLHDIQFCKHVKGDQELLLVAAENKKLTAYIVHSDSSIQPTPFAKLVGHDNRVKAFETLQIALPEASGRSSTTIISTVSSDGKIRVFDMHDIPEYSQSSSAAYAVAQVSPVAVYDSNSTRFTCVTLAEADESAEAAAAVVTRKRKRKGGDGSEESDEEGEEASDEDEDGDEGDDDEAEGVGSGWEDESEEELEGEEGDEEDED